MDSQAAPRSTSEQVSENKVGRAYRAAKMSSVGIEMAVATCIGWAFGAWLDGEWGTEPYFMFFGLAIGVAAGFIGMFRAANEAKRVAVESKQ